MEILEAFEALVTYLESLAGGRAALWIHVGAVLIIAAVVGKLLAKHVFRSDCGHLTAFLAALLPPVLGVAVWAVLTATYNPVLFGVGKYPIDLAILGGVLIGWIGGGLLTRAILGTRWMPALAFLLMITAAGAGGVLISHASLTVFRSGSAQVERNQDRLDLQ